VSKRKKPATAAHPRVKNEENESITTRAAVSPSMLEQAMGGNVHDEPTAIAPNPRFGLDTVAIAAAVATLDEVGPPSEAPASESIEFGIESDGFDAEATVNLVGDLPPTRSRDDLDAPTMASTHAAAGPLVEVDRLLVQRKHLRGLVEALVFASDAPIKTADVAKLASASPKDVRDLLMELEQDYATRGIHLDEVAGGWVFRTSAEYAPFVRDLTKQKPVRLTRAQVETLAIIAYRQPITRPEIDDVRGVDTGPVLKLLLERDLVRILGKRDEVGRPLIYGTTGNFLEFFGLRSLKDLPTLREFTELSDESREAFEDELGESPEDASRRTQEAEARVDAGGRGDDLGIGEPERQRSANESMWVPVGEHALDDLGDDDLEPLSDVDSSQRAHAADEDDPTLNSEARDDDDRAEE
jgi:segregation and condensation protein B